MKKYYYVTILAVCAVILLQTIYIRSLYSHYIDENITVIEHALSISIDKEQHLRTLLSDRKKPQKHQYMSIKRMNDMSPQERDSVLRLYPLPPMETYNIDSARMKGVVDTSVELIAQVLQDKLMGNGFPLDLKSLDSIFTKETTGAYPHRFLLYDAEKKATDSISSQKTDASTYMSELIPIGTKGQQYLQVKARIPFFPFVKNEIWPLLLSLALVVLTMGCVGHHQTVIRRKEALLQKREKGINGIIHDLKTPLNSVVTTLGWLKSDEARASKKKAIELCLVEVKHLVCNIESLLITVRKDNKPLILKKERINIVYLAELVKNSMDALYHHKPHSIAVENRLPEKTEVWADSMYIENVIRNLVENALKYSDAGVSVKMILSTTNRWLQVSVEDNGWGIAPRYQKKLFQQFYQVPREEDKICKGYGIGLAQSKYIIEEHGGKIQVNSAEGKGSVFTFNIPLA